jgi:YHS domain-containing protein
MNPNSLSPLAPGLPRTPILKRMASALLASALVYLMGCSAMQAQNPSGNLKPVNAHVVDNASSVMLKGHDVVSYFTDNKHALGSAQFASQYEGVNFYFASAEHKTLFDKEPTKYIPQYGGYCVFLGGVMPTLGPCATASCTSLEVKAPKTLLSLTLLPTLF